MNKVLLFGSARTGTVTLAHCLRHTAAITDGGNLVIDEPMNKSIEQLRVRGEDGAAIIKLYEKVNLLHKLDVEDTVPIADNLTSDEIYQMLDALFKRYDCVKHLCDEVSRASNKIVLDYAVDNNIKIVYQYREDLASTCLSKCMSMQTGQWTTLNDHSRDILNEAIYDPIPIPELHFLYVKMSSVAEVYTDYLIDKDVKFYRVCYEKFLHPDNDIENRINAFKKILEYIEWSYHETDIILKALHPSTKQHTDKEYNKVPNIEEIYEWKERISR
ncbi:hypothetical protein H8E06_00445 [bacterium]|nr:hypothetical protein [bacterium]